LAAWLYVVLRPSVLAGSLARSHSHGCRRLRLDQWDQAKIIYAYVTKTAFPSGTVLLLPLLFGALNANLPTLFGMYVCCRLTLVRDSIQ